MSHMCLRHVAHVSEACHVCNGIKHVICAMRHVTCVIRHVTCIMRRVMFIGGLRHEPKFPVYLAPLSDELSHVAHVTESCHTHE